MTADDRIGDSDLLGRIDDAFDDGVDPVPSHLASAARDAFAWRRADAALAEILFDSSIDDLVGVRGASTERRSFRFGAGDVVIRAHLTDTSLIVMIEPPMSVDCRVSTEYGTDAHRTDDFGELAIDPPELPLRLEVDLPAGTTVTPWITG